MKGDPILTAHQTIGQIDRSNNARVLLVGAGPGDPELITLKGLAAIRAADCIVYDRLVSPALLKSAKPGCELIFVGKENHHLTLPQDEINALLARKAGEHTLVVRLKGGDPFVFGRGLEEFLYLHERNISCAVIPGVTSAIAGPAAAGPSRTAVSPAPFMSIPRMTAMTRWPISTSARCGTMRRPMSF